MDRAELSELRMLLAALPDSRLRDLGLLAVAEIREYRAVLETLGQAIKDASK